MKAPIAAIFLILAACTDTESGDRAAVENEPSVFDPLTGTLDRARGVQDTIREGEVLRRSALEEAEGQ
jgi:hypothetical protein